MCRHRVSWFATLDSDTEMFVRMIGPGTEILGRMVRRRQSLPDYSSPVAGATESGRSTDNLGPRGRGLPKPAGRTPCMNEAPPPLSIARQGERVKLRCPEGETPKPPPHTPNRNKAKKGTCSPDVV